MDEDDEDPHTEAQTEKELHDETTYTVSASVKTRSKNIGPYSDVLVADYSGKEGRNNGPYSDLLGADYSGTAETNRNERRKDDDDVREKERKREMAKTEEQKKARVTAQQKYSDKKRKSMGEEAYLAERAKYAREYYREKSETEVGVPSTTYAAVRKRIQRERAALKKRETELAAAVERRNVTDNTTAAAPTTTATSTTEAAAILAGIASVTVPTAVVNTVDTNTSARQTCVDRMKAELKID